MLSLFITSLDTRAFTGRIAKPQTSPSSRGLGHRPFTAVTRVRIPLGARTTSSTSSKVKKVLNLFQGPVAQLVSAPPCHGGGRGFKSRPGRKGFGVVCKFICVPYVLVGNY